MRTTTKHPKTSTSDLDDRCLQRASVFLDSALAAHRDGSEPRAFSCAESAAALLSSYIDRTALKLGVKPLACVKSSANLTTEDWELIRTAVSNEHSWALDDVEHASPEKLNTMRATANAYQQLLDKLNEN